MPTQTIWVPPAVFLVHNNVTVYRAYVDDDVNQGACRHSFTVHADSDDDAFDIRQLAPTVLAGQPTITTSDDDPAYANLSLEQRDALRCQWIDWLKEGGGEETAIRKALMEAIA